MGAGAGVGVGVGVTMRAPSEVGVGVGDVVLAVPEGGYDLDVAALREPRIDVPQDAAGPRLHVRTASGSAVIERRSSGA